MCFLSVYRTDTFAPKQNGAMKYKTIILTALALSFAAFCSGRACGQNISVASNGADWLFLGSINAEVGYPLSRNYTLNAKASWNPFSFGNGSTKTQYKHISVASGVRYWPWFVNSGWFADTYLTWNKFSISGIINKKSYEGSAVGATIGGGYALMLSKGLNLEMGLCAFIGSATYTKYSCTVCGEKEGKSRGFVVSPGNVLLQIAFIF